VQATTVPSCSTQAQTFQALVLCHNCLSRLKLQASGQNLLQHTLPSPTAVRQPLTSGRLKNYTIKNRTSVGKKLPQLLQKRRHTHTHTQSVTLYKDVAGSKFVFWNIYNTSACLRKTSMRMELAIIPILIVISKSRGSSVSILSGYGLDDRAIGFDPRQGQRIFFPLACVSRPALVPAQPPVQWGTGGPFPGAKRGRGVTLTTHPI
jgi:hypothetical protein